MAYNKCFECALVKRCVGCETMRRTLAQLRSVLALLALTGGAWASDEIEISLRQFQPGQHIAVQTAHGVVWVLYRTKEALAEIERSQQRTDVASDPPGTRNKYRSIERKYFVVYPACPTPSELPQYDQAKWLTCLSTRTTYDLAGRPVNQPQSLAPMRVPAYKFKDKYTLMLPTK